MSDDDKAYAAVLLPAASVVLFTQEAHTKTAFLALADDWRFARVSLQAYEGDVEAAISTYAGNASPDLVIIQTDDINEGFPDRLEALASSCGEGTSAIVIGPVNDVNLYRKLIGMGVSDYIVRPVETNTLGAQIAATLLEKFGATGSRLITLIGAKGGVGVTSLSEALAWGVTETLGQKCFLMDAAGGWSTLGVALDFEPAATLSEVIEATQNNNKDALKRMTFSAHERLQVLSGAGDSMLNNIEGIEGYEALLDTMMATYPVVILDLSGAPPLLKRMALARANEIILVSAPTLPSIRSARSLMHEIKSLRGNSDKEIDIVLNMSGFSTRAEVPKAQIEEGLGRAPAATIAFAPDLFVNAESQGKKLMDGKGGQEIIDKILPLARKVIPRANIRETATETGGKAGRPSILTKLKAKS